MENAKIREMIKSDPEGLIDVIEERVKNINYLEDPRRNDMLDYIAAKVSSQVTPYLRLARQARRGYYPKWVEFQELLQYFGVSETLTRANNYGPMPERVKNHWESERALALEDYIFFFNELHKIEDDKKRRLFEESFGEWARPALRYAFEKAEPDRSDKELVSYISKAFYTSFLEVRSKSQGMNRRRVNGKWEYYYVKEVNDFDFTDNDVMQCIFRTNGNFPDLSEMAPLLTKPQVRLLINLNNIVRDDVAQLTEEEFYAKYPHNRMNYRQISEAMDVSYESFVKNIQRMKARLEK
ncbi:hypothetical protein IFR10_09490 [Bacillus sp. CFBP 13597]|nr:hypothetical protein [Bacillus sp. CFBP 13597]